MTLVALSATFLLSGCDDPGSTTKTISSVSQCRSEYNYTLAHCQQLYRQSIDQAKLTGKNYSSQQACIQDNSQDPKAQAQCQYTVHGSSGPHYFYIPHYYSYRPGSYAQPLYRRANSNRFFTSSGKTFSSHSFFNSSRTISRGGFGHFSGGHSHGG